MPSHQREGEAEIERQTDRKLNKEGQVLLLPRLVGILEAVTLASSNSSSFSLDQVLHRVDICDLFTASHKSYKS